MRPSVEVVVTSMDRGPFLRRCLASLGMFMPGHYVIRVLSDPETSQYEKYRQAFEDRQAPVMILTEDDVEVISNKWFQAIMDGFKFKDVALVGCAELKNSFDRGLYGDEPHVPFRYKPIGWVPGYVMAFDFRKGRLKPEDVVSDMKIPGCAGSADVDLSLQVRKAGFNVLLAECAVFHSRGSAPSTAEPWNANFRERNAYMQQKWGVGYLSQQLNDICAVKSEVECSA